MSREPRGFDAWRLVLYFAAIFGVAGGITGLIVGLRTHPATAWFAVIEAGLPATIVGGIIGLACVAAGIALRRH